MSVLKFLIYLAICSKSLVEVIMLSAPFFTMAKILKKSGLHDEKKPTNNNI